MRTPGIFIAGTDTGVGKTVVTGLLSRYLSDKGFSVITQKWVQTGSDGRADDIHSHIKTQGKRGSFYGQYSDLVVPYSFRSPVSPHLAAACENKNISSGKIKKSFSALAGNFDMVVVEGTGGVLVPINSRELMVDVVRDLEMDMLLVVGNRVGAINHALLTVEAVKSRGINVIGLVFNRHISGENEEALVDNRRVISGFSGVPDMGEIGHAGSDEDRYVNFSGIAERILDHMSLKK